MKNISGKLGLLVVAIIWGSGFVASSMALDYFTPYQTIALRFTLAFVASIIIFYKDLIGTNLSDLRKGGTIGIFLFFAFLFQTIGLQYTTASNNAFLTAVNIVIVPFLSWIILKERVPTKGLIGAVVTLIGISFLSLDFNNVTTINKGDLFTLVCAVFFALQIFYTDYYVEDIKTGVIMTAQMGMASLLSWIAVIFSKQTAMPITMDSIKPILYLGLISTMLAYGIQTWSQRRTTSTETAVILSTEAFFGMIASVIMLGEKITLPMIIGAILIFAGILIVEIKPRKKPMKYKLKEHNNYN